MEELFDPYLNGELFRFNVCMKKKKANIQWFDKNQLFKEAVKTLEDVDVVLDIGCGIMPQNFIKPVVHICCEPFDQYVTNLQKKINNECDRHHIIIKATWAEVIKFFPPKSVDSIFLVDVVEHLEKKQALHLIKKSEEIVRKQIVIFTPLGLIPQKHDDGKDAWGLDGGKWQEHKSGWKPEDFDATWKIYASSAYHYTDNLGRKLKKPFGAFLAIKTIKDRRMKNNNTALAIKESISRIYHLTIELNNLYALRFVSKILVLLNAMRRFKRNIFLQDNK